MLDRLGRRKKRHDKSLIDSMKKEVAKNGEEASQPVDLETPFDT